MKPNLCITLGAPIALAFTIPGPCVPWMRTATSSGHRVTPAKQRAYQRHVKSCADAARMRCRMVTGAPYPDAASKTARYAVALRIYVQDERRRDWDNLAKTVCDACTGVLWRDDSQVRRAFIDVVLDRMNPRVEVSVGLLP